LDGIFTTIVIREHIASIMAEEGNGADGPMSGAPTSGEETAVQDLDSISGVCKTMLDLVEELDALDKRIYHLKTDLVALSREHTDMTGFMRRRRHPMLHGVVAAQRPFERLDKLEQFDLLNKIMTMRLDMSIKFEALRKAKMAVQRARVIKNAFGIDLDLGSRRRSDAAAALVHSDPEEAEYIGGLLREQAELAGKIALVEEERLSKALDALNGKVQIMELFVKFNQEFDLYMDDLEDDLSDDNDDNDENVDDNIVKSAEDKQLEHRRKQLRKAENRVLQMKTLVQKLMFNCPDVIAGVGLEKEDAQECRDMMLFCGKTVEEMRTRNVD